MFACVTKIIHLEQASLWRAIERKSYNMKNERRLVARAQRDPQQFLALYDFYYPKIYAYTLAQVRHRETAEDVVQQTFSKALDKLKSFKWRRSANFGSWLFRIARNELLDQLKKGQRTQLVGSEQLETEPDERPVALEDLIQVELENEQMKRFQRILFSMKKLNQAEREVIGLKYFSALDYKQIAQVMNKKPNTLAVMLRRALQKIKVDLNV